MMIGFGQTKAVALRQFVIVDDLWWEVEEEGILQWYYRPHQDTATGVVVVDLDHLGSCLETCRMMQFAGFRPAGFGGGL